MQATTTAVRTLRVTEPLQTGPDVLALQHLLAQYGPGPADGQFGPLTAAAVKRAKWALGYPKAQCNGSAAAKFVGYLEGTAVPAAYATRAKERRQGSGLRQAIVANAQWGIANEPQIHYAEIRPIPALHQPRQLPLTTDCSGFATLCYAWAGAPDPNGLGYSGQGWTGTLLTHLKPVAQAAVQPGDLVVWGAPPGHHVAVVLEPGADPLLCSHGQERGPCAIRFSVESQYQPAQVTWLSAGI
jgi:cell wall-associated NlpC family hydrolase